MEMHNPAHPGELLREHLPETMTVTEAAQRLGIVVFILLRTNKLTKVLCQDLIIICSICGCWERKRGCRWV